MTSPYLERRLRSPAEILEGMRAKHPEYLDQIHALLSRAETLTKRIADEQVACSAASNSFADLAKAIGELRQDYLAPADADLKEWQRSRGEL